MKRAFLFGLATQFLVIAAIFLAFRDLMLPMTQSPVIGVGAMVLGAASGAFAWKTAPHPSWAVKTGMWFAGFLAPFVAIPVLELVVVLIVGALPD